MKKLLLIFIIPSLLLSGCATLSQKDLDAVERGEKAMIVSRCTAFTPPVGLIIKNYDPVVCFTGWDITEGRNEGLIKELLATNSQPISISVVQPGQYSLIYFQADNHDSWNGYTDTYKARDLNDIATFEVKGGDIIYIGDIEFNLRNSAIIAKAISVHDNTAAAKTALARRYSSIFSDQLRTQLIQLSPDVIKAKATNDFINTNFTQ